MNCEAANIIKSINAANRQIADIEKIRDLKGLDSLPAPLREMAEVRLQYQDTPLGEIRYLDDAGNVQAVLPLYADAAVEPFGLVDILMQILSDFSH